MPLFIDLPVAEVDSVDTIVAGWVAGARDDLPIRVLADGKPVPHFLSPRPDVRAAHAECPFATGVGAVIDILAINRPDFSVVLEYGEERVARSLRLTTRALSEQARERILRQDARAWCLDHMICLSCNHPDSTPTPKNLGFVCNICAAPFRQHGEAFDCLPDEMRFALTPRPETTSANPYDPAALALIEEVTAQDGMVLDCGAGARPSRRRNVINLEIVGYRSTDVLAVGEKLPFKDQSFDAILSLAVLEHVRDPFACAREMLRVVKPGGRIMCSVPFLQPEHNFPGHFYNMTQSGLANLFAGQAELIHAEVPPHGHPFFTVQWVLREYMAGLDEPARAAFAAITLGQAAAQDPAQFLAHPAANLSPEAMRAIACLNTMVFRRP